MNELVLAKPGGGLAQAEDALLDSSPITKRVYNLVSPAEAA
jgi:hypothetical protein